MIEPAALPDGIALRTFIQGEDDKTLVESYRGAFRDHYGHLERPFQADVAT